MKKSQLTITDVQQLHQAGRLEEAEQGYQDILAHDPKDVSALHFLGILYAEKGELDKAIIYIEKAIREKPNDPTLSLHLANILKTANLFDQAEQILLTVIQSHPTFAAAFNNLGTVYFAQNKWQEAKNAYQAAIDNQPNYVDAYYNLGLVLGKLKSWPQAINAYQAVLALSPQHPGGHFQLGCLMMRQRQYQSAIHHFLLILEAYPFHVETQTNLATCYLKLGMLAEAKAHYLKALEIQPDDSQVLFNLGVIHMQQSHLEEAVKYYSQAVKVKPNYYEGHNNLAFAYLVMKKREEALLHFREALRLQPDNVAIRHTIDILTQKKDISGSPTGYIRSLFDSYADHYDQHLVQSLQYKVPQLMYEVLQEYNADLAEKWEILDIGCGTGLCGELFKPLAKSLIGVDISEQMLTIAAQKNIYDKLVLADIVPYLSAQKEQYDLILAADVLIYFGDLSGLFSAVFQALKSNGLFFFNAEISENKDYEMTSSGRFVHSKAYLDKLAQEYQLSISFYRMVTMRTQDQKPVLGHLYLLRRG